MTKQRSELRILLLQIRDEAAIRQEEHASFVRYGELEPEQLDILNVFDRPEFSPDVLKGYDALFIGGASEASVLEPREYPFVADGQRLITHCIDREVPVFASCFGFQMAVLALGGEVIRDRNHYEMGTIPIRLHTSAVDDPLLTGMPGEFLAVSVHQEKSLTVPSGCELLASTDDCIHAFRVGGKPFWAFQFHPEVDRATLVSRLTFFKERYTKDDEHLDEVISNAEETPDSNRLVARFVDLLTDRTDPISSC